MSFEEPPLKRARRSEPAATEKQHQQQRQPWEDDEDADELVFRSHVGGPEFGSGFGLGLGLDARMDRDKDKDDGYRMSIERAYSDQRFQATMAHIFDKYGRDFDGIGDEIDLLTGEIVVNNGHICNMRNEMDVGSAQFLQQQQQQQQQDSEDDDGVLLEEFLQWNDELERQYELDGQAINQEEDIADADEESTQQQQHHQQDPDEDDDSATQDDSSTALVPRSDAGAPPGAWGFIPSPAAAAMPGGPGPWTTPFGASSSPYGFGPSSITFSPAAPYTMGASPFPLLASHPHPQAPWGGMSSPFPEPRWMVPQAQIQQPNLSGPRYNFKAQKGSSSIWAIRSRYKEGEDEPLRSYYDSPRSRIKMKVMKGLPAPAGSPRTSRKRASIAIDDDYEEEDILSSEANGSRDLGLSRRQSAKKRMTRASKRPKHHHDHHEDHEDSLPRLRRSSRVHRYEHDSETRDIRIDTDGDLGMSDAMFTATPRRSRRKKRISTPEPDPEPEPSSASENDSGSDETWGIGDPLHEEPAISGPPEPKQADGHSPRKGAVRLRRSLRHDGRVNSRVEQAERVESVDRMSRETTLVEPRPQIFLIELPAVGRDVENEYQMVGAVENLEDVPDLPNEKPDTKEPAWEASPIEELSDHEVMEMKETSNDQHQHITEEEEDPACVFSDDEAPIVLPTVKLARTPKAKANFPRRSNRNNEDFAEYNMDMDMDTQQEPLGEEHEESAKYNEDLQEALSNGKEIFAKSYMDLREATIGDKPEDEAAKNLSLLAEFLAHGGEAGSETPEASADFTSTQFEPDDASSSLADRLVEFAESSRLCTPEIGSAPGRPIEISSDAEVFSSSPTRGLTHITARPSRGKEEEKEKERNGPVSHDEPLPERRSSGRRTTTTTTTRISTSLPKQAEQPSPAPEQPNNKTRTKTNIDLQTPPTTTTTDSIFPSTSIKPPSPVIKPPSSRKQTGPRVSKPRTPRRRLSKPLKLPSRHSILSLLPPDHEIDELGRSLAALPALHTLSSSLTSSSTTPKPVSNRRLWKSSARTTEVYRTPVRKRPISPGSMIQSPGGTVRVCGVGGYRCGRDFCFTCL